MANDPIKRPDLQEARTLARIMGKCPDDDCNFCAYAVERMGEALNLNLVNVESLVKALKIGAGLRLRWNYLNDASLFSINDILKVSARLHSLRTPPDFKDEKLIADLRNDFRGNTR